MGEGGKKN